MCFSLITAQSSPSVSSGSERFCHVWVKSERDNCVVEVFCIVCAVIQASRSDYLELEALFFCVYLKRQFSHEKKSISMIIIIKYLTVFFFFKLSLFS